MTEKKIPGIHNYCDRWCERCYFTSRCAVFADTSPASAPGNDIANEAFWKRLSENFAKAHQLLGQAAAKHGIDLNRLAQDMQEEHERHDRVWQMSSAHPLAQLSDRYSEAARHWLATQPGMMELLQDLKSGLEMGTASVASAKMNTETIRECVAVIQWYETFIHAKVMRALTGKMDAVEPIEGFPSDADGSAKIALIATERSMHAWMQLHTLLPDREDDFLGMLSMLEKLKRLIEAEFPGARKFRRPGFDD